MPAATHLRVEPASAVKLVRISEYYKPFPRQEEFHRSRAKYRLFGGAAGPGKTMALLYEAIGQANKVAGCDTLLLRRTFPELESSLLNYFRRDVPRDLYESYNDSKHTVTWRNGSTTRFGHCGNENDVYQYQGAEFLFIGFDELTHFTLKQWQYLTSRNRCKVPGSRPNMAGATNPGNIGHAWVKALWIDKRPAPGMIGLDGFDAEKYDAAEYDFIRATLDDNPIYANDPSYRKTLAQLPEFFRRALLLGDWNVFAGQYFDIFQPSRHVVPASAIPLEAWSSRWISIDWGFDHPSAVHWHTASPDGRICTYREMVCRRMAPQQLGGEIARLSVDSKGRAERISSVYLGPDAFAQRTAEHTIAEQLGDALAPAGIPRPGLADNDRVGGWMLMYQLLDADQWVISESCERLIECMPTLTRDEDYTEDILKIDGDDPADSARYGLKSHLAPGRKPVEQRVAERIHATDPTSVAILSKKFMLEEKKKVTPVLPRRWRPRHGPA